MIHRENSASDEFQVVAYGQLAMCYLLRLGLVKCQIWVAITINDAADDVDLVVFERLNHVRTVRCQIHEFFFLVFELFNV